MYGHMMYFTFPHMLFYEFVFCCCAGIHMKIAREKKTRYTNEAVRCCSVNRVHFMSITKLHTSGESQFSLTLSAPPYTVGWNMGRSFFNKTSLFEYLKWRSWNLAETKTNTPVLIASKKRKEESRFNDTRRDQIRAKKCYRANETTVPTAVLGVVVGRRVHAPSVFGVDFVELQIVCIIICTESKRNTIVLSHIQLWVSARDPCFDNDVLNPRLVLEVFVFMCIIRICIFRVDARR